MASELFGKRRPWRFLIYCGAALLVVGFMVAGSSYFFADPRIIQSLIDYRPQKFLAAGGLFGIAGLAFLGTAFYLRWRSAAFSENRDKAVLEGMSDLIHIIDRHYQLLFTNPAYEQWADSLGLPAHRVGHPLFAVFPFLSDKIRAEYEQVFATGEVLVTTEKFSIGEPELTLEVRKVPVFQSDKVEQVLTVIHNVTDRVQAEVQLNLRNSQLEERAIEHTAALEKSNQQLQQTIHENERLRQVEKALHDFMLELASTTGLQEALTLCLDRAIKISGLDSGGIYLYDHASAVLKLACSEGLKPEIVGAGAIIHPGGARWNLVMRGDPVYDVGKEIPLSYPSVKAEGLSALAILPISHQRQLIGCFSLASHTLSEIPETARAVLDTIAAQVGTIIARLQMEDALRESEEKAQALLNATYDAAYLLDFPGTVLGVNENGARRFNHSIEELLGKCIYDFFPPSLLALRREHMENVFQTGISQKYEGERDGLWMENSVYPIFDAQGNVTKIAVFSCDITRQRTAENKRAQLFDEVKAARLQLQERAERLEDANARLKELDRIKSQFLANMSHELRTPLNSIIGFSEVLQDGILGEVSEQQRSALEEIWRSSQHLLDLINDLLDFSRIENGRMTLHKTTFRLCDLVDEVKTTISPLTAKKSQELGISLQPGLPPLTTDRLRLKQILLNLMSNASKFTQPGGHITLACSLKENDQVQFSVADDGIGISPEDQQIIFEEFRQVDGTVTRSEAGSGLGLTISKRLVELAGGQIWVESQLGQGSVFTFLLPILSEGLIQA